MHPSPAFEWTDREAMLAFIDRVSFATILVLRAEGATMVHAPVVVHGHDRLRFHLSRRNAAAVSGECGGLVSVLGQHAYISPDWYGSDDQVPTWNYLAVECEGVLKRLPDKELPPLLDALSATQEGLIDGKRPWTREKMSGGRFEAMCRAIAPYEMTISVMRGTRKLGQNKQRAEVEGAAAALRQRGQSEIADLMIAEKA